MKFLKKFLITVLLLVLLTIVGLIVFIKTFDVNRLKPQIISQARAVLHRPVDFSTAALDITLSQGLSLKLSGLKISEDAAFGEGTFLSIKNASAGIDILGFLQRREISVTGIRIDEPRVTIIRDKDGRINAQTIGQASAEAGPQGVPSGSSVPSPSALSSGAALPALFISSINASNGSITYIDRTFDPALQFEVKDFSVQITGFSLRDRFPFTVEATVCSDRQNIKVEGQARLNAAANEVTVTDLKATTELYKLSMKTLKDSLPMLKDVSLPESLGGVAVIAVKELSAGPAGLSSVEADISLSAASVKLKELASPLDDLNVHAHVTADKVGIDTLTGRIAGGSINGTGELKDYLKTQDYSLNIAAGNVKIEELLPEVKGQPKPEGVASLKAQVSGKGFTPESLKSNLTGSSDIAATQLKLRDFNVLEVVLDKTAVIPGIGQLIGVIPNLSQYLAAQLPEPYKTRLQLKDTVLSDTKLAVVIENGTFVIRNAEVGSEDFLFRGAGKADFNGVYVLDGDFLIQRDLSQAIAKSASILNPLMNADGLISFPVKIIGSKESLNVKADTEYIGKKVISSPDGIANIINKALGHGGDSQQQGENAAGKKGSSSTNDIGTAVSNVLDRFLKK